MKLIDRQYLATPFYGARKLAVELKRQKGFAVNRKRVRRLMQFMGIRAIYRRPRTSKPAVGHQVYPYLLRDLKITRPNQVWAADITYIPMARGFLYLVSIIDWYSRYVIAWRLSNTLDADFCVAALEEALSKGTPEIFNTNRPHQSLGYRTPAEVYAGAMENTCINVVESLVGNTVGMAGLSLSKAPILSY